MEPTRRMPEFADQHKQGRGGNVSVAKTSVWIECNIRLSNCGTNVTNLILTFLSRRLLSSLSTLVLLSDYLRLANFIHALIW